MYLKLDASYCEVESWFFWCGGGYGVVFWGAAGVLIPVWLPVFLVVPVC